MKVTVPASGSGGVWKASRLELPRRGLQLADKTIAS
jgi:hypothetical protein